MPNAKLAIIQDYVPGYRVGFFGRLVVRLADTGIACTVVAGRPPGSAAKRSNAVSSADWLRQVDAPWEFWPRHRGPRFFGYGSDRHWKESDGVIMGLRGTSLDLHLELIKRMGPSTRLVGVWGHLSRFVNPPSAIDLAIERWQMRRCDHVFAYTRLCRDAAIASGIQPEKVTAVMNSVDVEDLMSMYDGLTGLDIERFADRYGLTIGKVFGFIGGLDAPKRIEFLAATLDCIWETDRQIKIVIAGRGEQENLLNPAIVRGQAIMLGHGGPMEKAFILRLASALVNPGRVGLLAVESLATGVPILTTDWGFHAPEFDYLEPGIDVYVSPNEVSGFSDLILSRTSEDGTLTERSGRRFPTIGDMVENFAIGVEKMYGVEGR